MAEDANWPAAACRLYEEGAGDANVYFVNGRHPSYLQETASGVILGLALAPGCAVATSVAFLPPGSHRVGDRPTEAGTLAAIPYPRAVTDGRDRASPRAVGPVRRR